MPYEIEVLKLLARLAAADGVVEPVEIAQIAAAGRAAGVSDRAIEQLRNLLEAHGGLPEPDLAILRQKPHLTMAAAREMVAVDGVLADAEMAALRRLAAQLGLDDIHD